MSGNLKEIKTIKIETYDISYTQDVLQIGCKRYSINTWKSFEDEEVARFDENALEFWKKWKVFIFTAIELSFPSVEENE